MLARIKTYGIPKALIIFGLSAFFYGAHVERLEANEEIALMEKEYAIRESSAFGKPKLSANNKKKSISWRWIALSSLMLSLLLTLSGCANYSLKSNPVVVQTSNVAITESSDASSFCLKLTAWREKVKLYLTTETQD